MDRLPGGIPLSPREPEPHSEGARGASRSLGEPKPNFLFETCFARTTSRVVANSSPRQTHERRVLHEGASFAFCAAFSRGGPGRLVRRCLGVFTAGSPDSPAGRPDGQKVSPVLPPGRVPG